MEIRQCGTSGLLVSELGLGTLMWGRDTEVHEAQEMLGLFVDAGGTLVECAPWHGDGAAVDVLAQAIRAVGRHRVVVAWRGGARCLAGGVLASSAGRGHMLASFDEALGRLGTDYIDLWLAGPDPKVPLDETLGALDVAHRTGRAHYVGLDHRSLWDTAQAVWAGQHGDGPVVSAVEVDVSLLTAKRSAHYVARAADAGLGVLAHSPLAGGVLTGKYRHSTPPDSRAASDHLRHTVAPHLENGVGIVEAVARAADGLDLTMVDVALSWVRGYPGVTAAVVGPRTVRQLEQILEANTVLPEPIRAVLNEVSGR